MSASDSCRRAMRWATGIGFSGAAVMVVGIWVQTPANGALLSAGSMALFWALGSSHGILVGLRVAVEVEHGKDGKEVKSQKEESQEEASAD